jgi:hypothetical protein
MLRSAQPGADLLLALLRQPRIKRKNHLYARWLVVREGRRRFALAVRETLVRAYMALIVNPATDITLHDLRHATISFRFIAAFANRKNKDANSLPVGRWLNVVDT